MNWLRKHRLRFVVVACFALLLPSMAHSAGPPSTGIAKLSIADIRLDRRGMLHGQLLDRQGQAIADTIVVLSASNNQVWQAITNEHGQFRFDRVRGGVYKVAAGNTVGIYRLWTDRTAPPSSRDRILLVNGPAVRGQHGHHHIQQHGLGAGHYDGAILKTLNDPWVLAGLVGAGMAVPIAISSNNDREGS